MRPRIPLFSLGLAILLGRAVAAQVPTGLPGSVGSPDSAVADSTFARVWRASCSPQPPRDSAFVYGFVRDSKTHQPVSGANVDVVWTQLESTGKSYRQRRLKLSTETNVSGVFGICGVPTGFFLRIGAGHAGRVSGLIDVTPNEQRVLRRDLELGADTDSSERGSVFGSVTDVTGAPIDNARVVIDDTVEVRSRADGRFSARNLPTGTRQVETFAIGMAPVVLAVDVSAADTVPVAVHLRRITALDAVRVTATRRSQAIVEGIAERKRLGQGYLIEAGEIYGHADLVSVLQEFPSTEVSRSGGNINVLVGGTKGGTCAPEVWVDGAKSAQEILPAMRMTELVAVEMFVRPESVPMQFKSESTSGGHCGAIVIWTTWAFKR